MSMLDMDIGDVLKKITGGNVESESTSSPGVTESSTQSSGDKPKKTSGVTAVEAPKSALDQIKDLPRKAFFKHVVSMLVLVGVYGAYVYLQYLPQEKVLTEQLEQTKQTSSLRGELDLLRLQAKKAKKDLDEAQVRYDALSKLFVTEMELEALYAYISQIALEQNLIIDKITKGKKIAIDRSGNVAKTPDKSGKDSAGMSLSYYRIPVELELVGTYANYVKYRSKIAQIDKTINIDKEKVSIASKEGQGKVRIATTLSTYRIP